MGHYPKRGGWRRNGEDGGETGKGERTPTNEKSSPAPCVGCGTAAYVFRKRFLLYNQMPNLAFTLAVTSSLMAVLMNTLLARAVVMSMM